MEKVVNSDGSTEWNTFLDGWKNFCFPGVFADFPESVSKMLKELGSDKVENGKMEKYGRLARKWKSAITTLYQHPLRFNFLSQHLLRYNFPYQHLLIFNFLSQHLLRFNFLYQHLLIFNFLYQHPLRFNSMGVGIGS